MPCQRLESGQLVGWRLPLHHHPHQFPTIPSISLVSGLIVTGQFTLAPSTSERDWSSHHCICVFVFSNLLRFWGVQGTKLVTSYNRTTWWMSSCHHLCKFAILPELLIKLPFPDEKVGGWEQGRIWPHLDHSQPPQTPQYGALWGQPQVCSALGRKCQKVCHMMPPMFSHNSRLCVQCFPARGDPAYSQHNFMVKSGTLAQLAA